MTDKGKNAADRLLAEEAALDRALAFSRAPAPPSDLAGRILAAAPSEAGQRLPGWLFPVWRPAGALAVALMLGLAVGAMTPPDVIGTQQQIASTDDVDLLDSDVPTLAGLDDEDQ